VRGKQGERTTAGVYSACACLLRLEVGGADDGAATAYSTGAGEASAGRGMGAGLATGTALPLLTAASCNSNSLMSESQCNSIDQVKIRSGDVLNHQSDM
jgi:hypothetical protein